LHVGQKKIPTLNSGTVPLAVCFIGVAVQHLTAVAIFVPQFGQLTNK
jgi:hypothetical protein